MTAADIRNVNDAGLDEKQIEEIAADGGTQRPRLPHMDRTDPPAYLQKYLERESHGGKRHETIDRERTDETPLYLRRFRDRRSGANALETPLPLWEGHDLGVTMAKAQITKTKEIVPEDKEQSGPALVTQVHIIRHGETQGYSTESGLTPLGSWQVHRRGFDISKSIREGERVHIVCADTNRARQTSEGIRKGLLDGLTMWGREAEISEVEAMEEFRNFQVWTPEGLRDVTGAFRLYKREMEKYERVAMGDRPTWLVEMDRFWKTQQGGADPITLWTQIPMLNFEPPSATVRRFWAGIQRIQREHPGDRIIVGTHSGPIRVFAISAFGYDPGEPYNTEEVIVRLVQGNSAFIAYRNRVQEVQVPDLDQLPDWWEGLSGRALPRTLREEEQR
ncbi:MAG: histidine phosphatase family protein [Actinomycetota bacterium]|nr:histidine phosphatase family protein [Actinomycetota bacterium]